jgi:uncharacterized membrane protein
MIIASDIGKPCPRKVTHHPMKEKIWGSVLIFAGIIIMIISFVLKIFRDECTNCSLLPYVLVWFLASIMTAAGLLLRRSDELDKILASSQLKMNEQLMEAKRKEREKESFQEFLSDFSGPEKALVETVHTYEGITLADLEKRVGLAKNTFRKTLQDLERRQIISIMDDKAYLRKMSK